MAKTIYALLSAILLFAWAFAPTPSPAADNCGLILNTKCNMCHNHGRICRKLGKKDKSQWQKTIKRMVRHGAPLNQDEQKELALCLANKTEGVKNTCK
jgi:cytochrome c5